MVDTTPSVLEMVQLERNRAVRELHDLNMRLATLVGAHIVAGSIPVDKIRALLDLSD